MIAERHLDSVLLDYLSNRDATTTSACVTFDPGVLSHRGQSAWIPTSQTAAAILRVGDRCFMMFGGGAVVMPTWLRPTLESIAPLLKLKEGWDSYGGQPLDERVVKTVVEVLSAVMDYDSPAPSVVPTSFGGVQLEWHRGGIDLEVAIAPSGEVFFDFETTNGEEITGNFIDNPGRLAQLVSRLPK